ncbi:MULTISPECIES: AAA family ATPase [unclassified Microbacterium]|uniref:AAA family ATPase n=1 Tax=unclassified Microbacterium TaxID=2609290 RepID=UPI003650FDCF
MPDDAAPVPAAPQRILIAGVTGSGKTTLARRVGAIRGLPHIEMDALFHGPDWTPRPAFLDDVREFVRTDRWVTEWQYSSKGTDPILAPRADLMIWLDYPYRIVRTRLIWRTMSRSVRRTDLWNGNRERPLWDMLRRGPEENILRWQTTTLHKWRDRMPAIAAAHPDLPILRFAHPREAERWMRTLRPGP